MKYPKKFVTDLHDAYEGRITLDQLIKNNETFLRGMARYAARFPTHFMCSDEDDLYQEVCFWLIDSMWRWEEDKGVSLERYVIHNIGTRVSDVVKFEKNIKRHPSNHSAGKDDIWGIPPWVSDDGSGFTRESTLPTNVDVEMAVAVKQAFDRAEAKLTETAKHLLVALIENEGVFTQAIRDLTKNRAVTKLYGTDEDHLKYCMKNKVMEEIFHNFEIGTIIPL